MKDLRELRQKNGLTVRKVSVLLDVTTVTINRWEAGKRTPSIVYLPKLSEVYKASFEEIYQAVMASNKALEKTA